MGRKRNVYLREFYDYDTSEDASVCKLCGWKLSGSYTTNLKRHMMKNHMEEYKDQTNSRNNTVTEKKIKFSVEFSPEQVRRACVNLVTKELHPFAMLDGEAFRELTGPIFNGLNMSRISSHNIMDFVNETYDNLRQTIINLCKERLICLKMDIASRLDRSVLGINVQFFHEDRIEIFTLAMKELHGRHTALNLKEELENVLRDFGINKKQIFCITTDNGSNMLKTVEKLSDDFTEIEDEFVDSESYTDDSLIENPYHTEIDEDIISIRCAAHTLQLAVTDFLTTMETTVISRAREIIKKLRTSTARCSLQTLNLGKPSLDVVTRWGSTYKMLNNFLQYEEFCRSKLRGSSFTDEDWVTTHNIVKVLNPVNAASIQLQRAQLYLGDFYILWLNLKSQIKRMQTSIADSLLACLERRESDLLNNDVLNAAIFLDPRIKRLLSTDEKCRAKEYLKNIAKRMLSLKQDTRRMTTRDESERDDLTMSTTDLLNACRAPNSSSLQSTIEGLEVDLSTDDDTEDDNTTQILKAYEEIENYKEKRVNVDNNLIDYWHQKKYKLYYLTKIAKLVHAVPCTQVSVERCFSSLKLILSDKRYNLSENTLAKIMFVKLNNK